MSAVAVPSVLVEPMRVEPMHEADLDGVLAIERSVYEFPWTSGNFRDSMRAGYQCRVAWHDGALLGYFVLLVGAGEAHLLNLSVAAPMQRRGYGRFLLQEVIDQARRAVVTQMVLEVRPSNGAAQALYQSYGFRQIGVRRNYYPAAAGREDALVLAFDLRRPVAIFHQ